MKGAAGREARAADLRRAMQLAEATQPWAYSPRLVLRFADPGECAACRAAAASETDGAAGGTEKGALPIGAGGHERKGGEVLVEAVGGRAADRA